MILDHVQLAIPPGRESEAEAFYADILGFSVVPKPPRLAIRGGRWFEKDAIKLHLGVDVDFVPSYKVHICLVVSDYDELLESFAQHGVTVTPDHEIDEVVRCYVRDPFGNRIEIQRAG